MILWAQGKSGSALPHPWPWFLVEGQGHIRCPVPSFAAFTTSPNFTRWLYANVLLWDLQGSLYTCFLKEKLFPERNGSELTMNSSLAKDLVRSFEASLGTPTEVVKPVLFTTYQKRSQTWGNLREETRDLMLPVWSVNSPKKKSAHVPLQERAFGTDLGQCLVHLRTLQLGSPFQVQFANHRDESLQMARLQNWSNRFKQKHLWICKRNSFEMNLDLHLSKCYAAMHICCHCPFSDVAKSRCVQTPCSNPPGGRELGTAMGEQKDDFEVFNMRCTLS